MSAATQFIDSALGGIWNDTIGLALQPLANQEQQANNQVLQNQQLQANEALSSFNYAQQYDMWQKTNAPAQVQQLEQAGLNPALMYSKGMGPGGTTGTPSGGAGMGIAQGTNPAQLAAATAENQSTQADIRLKNAQAANIEARTPQEAGLMTAETQQISQQIDNLKAQVNNTEANTALTNFQTGIAAVQATVSQNTISEQIATIKGQYDQLQQQIKALVTQNKVTSGTADNIIDQSALTTIQQQVAISAAKAGINLTYQQIQQIGQDMHQQLREYERGGDYLQIAHDQQQVNKGLLEVQQLAQKYQQTWGQATEALSDIFKVWTGGSPNRNPIGFKQR